MFTLGTADNRNSALAQTFNADSFSIDKTAAQTIAEALDSQRSAINSYVAAAIPYVMREYPAFNSARSADSAAYARHAVIMAILSPQLDFRHNLELAQIATAALPRLQSLADVEDCLFITDRNGNPARFNGWRGKCLTLFRALPYLRSIGSAADVTYADLIAQYGIGPKVAAFALHMIDWRAPVFTLDVHMLRLFCQLAGLPIAANVSITPAAYPLLQTALVEYCGAHFPQYPLFAVQWALWDCVHGYHVAHESLFG